MTSQIDKAEQFRRLHVPHDPIILHNIWDAGSAKAVERAGAEDIATGSWCERVALPVNMMAQDPESVHDLATLGVSRISFGPNPYRVLMADLKRRAHSCF